MTTPNIYPPTSEQSKNTFHYTSYLEIFRTNVSNEVEANQLLKKIHVLFPKIRANFDLEDCDRILRVNAPAAIIKKVPGILMLNGFECHVLPD